MDSHSTRIYWSVPSCSCAVITRRALSMQRRTGLQQPASTPPAQGAIPSAAVHPNAIGVAAERGIDLSDAVPRGYESIRAVPDVLISVCDRAREEALPEAGRHLHWSIPDPVSSGRVAAFRSAFSEVERRVDQLIA